MSKPSLPIAQHQHLLGSAMIWLFSGSLLLLTTVVPAHTVMLGWTPAFWLVVAPMIVLLTLEPDFPRQCLALCRPHRRIDHSVIWH